ncbi:hypothetical protein BJ322DRAFT_1113630 [Thelephora terrestris]|uniref:Uncharacterized protein n=1 Tax=Thelephora terrestris TaxID=56493 RepID=A0A9P6H7J7_9AGAM|nr:hypothetical protein BJ322DRAFT_1113630 [Thelephora terrestris]
MVGPSKLRPTTPNAQKPEVDLHTATPEVENEEHRRHELSEAMKAALSSNFPKSEPDPRKRFREQFRKEADEYYDHDFHNK